MSSTKKVTSSRVLSRQESLQYIRSQTITFRVRGARPNTRLFVFFDEEEVTNDCFVEGSTEDFLITDNDGNVDIRFFIAAGKYTVGIKQVIVADTNDLFLINVPGTVNGSSRGTFAATGRIDFYQTTEVTTIDTIITDVKYNYITTQNQNPPQVDPPRRQALNDGPIQLIGGGFGGGIPTTGVANYGYNGNDTSGQPDYIITQRGKITDPNAIREFTEAANQQLEKGKSINFTTIAVSLPSDVFEGPFDPYKDYYEDEYTDCKTQDPLAQSFFTYGIKGGFFLTGVEVYFASKDPDVPVRMEIRPMVNGYPSDLPQNNPNLVSFVNPKNIITSQDASEPTLFKFEVPIYLAEDKDYCFVLLSNSNKYNVFTSQMGELSIENDRAILEQPFIGSLFKSENNITWTAYQYEDIKFKMYKAKFDISQPAIIDLESVLPVTASSGDAFYTNSGSSRVYYVAPRQHGLQIGDKIAINAIPTATYNGILGEDLSGEFDVVDIRSEIVVGFDAKNGATANKDGRIIYGDGVVKVEVQSPGINYQEGNTTITFSTGNAAAAPVIENGRIVAVNITNMGTGYETPPQITVNSPTGTGAVLIAVLDPMFTVNINKNVTSFSPHIKVLNYDNSFNRNFVQTTIGNYQGGNLVSYTSGSQIEFSTNNSLISLPTHSLIASRNNEFFRMGNSSSMNINLELYSTNENVSPLLDTRSTPQIFAYETSINNQPGEDRSSSNPTGSIDFLSITSAGTGYTVTPTVEFIGGGGSGAAATVTLTNGEISGVEITDPGTGYIRPPLVRVIPAAGDTNGQGGAIRAFLTPFNSELLAGHGNALARYLTRKIFLSTVSTGIRLFSTISSQSNCNVDWYVRTSLSSSGVDHDQVNWKRLECPIERNQSSSAGEFLEYLFELNDLPEFDTYDLKCVMLSDNPINTPYISGYRVIVVA